MRFNILIYLIREFVRIHLIPRRAEHSRDLEAALEYLILIIDEHSCDGDSFADCVFHIYHILCKPVIREAHADKSDASSDHRLPVRGKILTGLSGCQRSIEIKNEAESVIRRNVLRRF